MRGRMGRGCRAGVDLEAMEGVQEHDAKGVL
jgi:hypothetical protein